jgi:hypothetical protein
LIGRTLAILGFAGASKVGRLPTRQSERRRRRPRALAWDEVDAPAAGALTGDRRLKNEGRVEQAKGSAKKAVDKAADTVTGRKRNNKQT